MNSPYSKESFYKLKKKIILLIYLFLTVPGLCCCMDFSLVVVSRGYSLDEVLRLLIVMASLAAEHRL